MESLSQLPPIDPDATRKQCLDNYLEGRRADTEADVDAPRSPQTVAYIRRFVELSPAPIGDRIARRQEQGNTFPRPFNSF